MPAASVEAAGQLGPRRRGGSSEHKAFCRGRQRSIERERKKGSLLCDFVFSLSLSLSHFSLSMFASFEAREEMRERVVTVELMRRHGKWCIGDERERGVNTSIDWRSMSSSVELMFAFPFLYTFSIFLLDWSLFSFLFLFLDFCRDEIQRIKAGNPDISHREAFSAAAKNVSTLSPWLHPHLDLSLSVSLSLSLSLSFCVSGLICCSRVWQCCHVSLLGFPDLSKSSSWCLALSESLFACLVWWFCCCCLFAVGTLSAHPLWTDAGSPGAQEDQPASSGDQSMKPCPKY